MSRNSGNLWMVPFIVSIFCFMLPAYARYKGGTGEPNDPYQIANVKQLVSIGSDPRLLNKSYLLVNDLDLDPNLPGNRIFTRAVIAPDLDLVPEFQGNVFTGIFDGNGHTINHLTIKADETRYLGLFGKIGSKGTVRDLHLEDIRISSSGFCIGGLVGYNRGRIINCRVSGSLSGGAGAWCSRFGLVAGTNVGYIGHCDINGSITTGSLEDGRGGSIGLLVGTNRGFTSHCSVAGSFRGEGTFNWIGGLIGRNLNSIADCRSAVEISVISKYANGGKFGGLVGINQGPISRSFATGNVSGGRCNQNLGGLAGLNAGVITDCYAEGDSSGEGSSYQAGGLAGYNSGCIFHSYGRGAVTADGRVGGLVGENSGSISQCYATGKVIRLGRDYMPVGGLVGNRYSSDITGCFWDIEASEMTASKEGTGLTTAQMHDRQTFITSGWDFIRERRNGTADVWLMPKSRGYPLLAVFSDDYRPDKLKGSGNPNDPYLIGNTNDLAAIRNYNSTACFELTSNIDLSGITWTTPVIPSFEGRFNGNGNTVSNLNLHGDGPLGLFGILWDNAVVENLQISDANVVAGDTGSSVGILAAKNRGRIAGCRIAGNISGGRITKELAGFVGQNLGTITYCEPVVHDGPYSVIVADPKETRRFLKFEGIRFHQVWIPEETDLEGLESIVRMYLDRDIPIRTDFGIDSEYILANFRRYNREYSGFIRNGTKYIICSMILSSDSQGSHYVAEHNRTSRKTFTIIMDGGCSVVRMIFNAKSKNIVKIECNGE